MTAIAKSAKKGILQQKNVVTGKNLPYGTNSIFLFLYVWNIDPLDLCCCEPKVEHPSILINPFETNISENFYILH